VASVQGHPRRNAALTPFGLTGLLITLAVASFRPEAEASVPTWPCLFLGFFGALVNVPLRAGYLAAVPADARGNAMAVMNALIYLLTVLLALLLFGGVQAQVLPTPAAQLAVLAGVTGLGAILAWRLLFPQAVELLTAMTLVPMYRVRAHGPGKDRLPATGPLIVVANHSSYLDPFWLGKLYPGHLRPLMTSVFYDLPVVRWMMVHVVEAIRVPLGGGAHRPTDGAGELSPAQRLPELREAIAALRRGDCLLIFPEGQLRRKPDQYLRQFGQGIWHILRELPDTPVLPVWIEGGWGSWASYANGKPFKNKRPDWRRPIDVAFGEPAPLPADVLAQHRTTRTYLMRACLECRRHLGLEVPTSGASVAESAGPGEAEDLTASSGAAENAHENHT
jgi:1-acyl-sn-glycerol-3-phosphate acyltransferase